MPSDRESILRFWRDVEVFNVPTAPGQADQRKEPRTDVIKLGKGEQPPWLISKYQNTDTHIWTHSVYIGTANTEEIIKLIVDAVLPGKSLSERELNRISGRSWLAAFTVAGTGVPIVDSYTLASFVVGVERTRENRSFDDIAADLHVAREKFAERRHISQPTPDSSEDGNASKAPQPQPLRWNNLQEEIDAVATRLGKAGTNIGFGVIIKSAQRKRKKNTADSAPDVDFLNSFYLDDLDCLIDQSKKHKRFGKALAAFLGDPLPTDKRVDLLADPALMASLAGPGRMPAGRWPAPSTQSLFLAQQDAVYEIVDRLRTGPGIIGVNGPPGTGKTTLLCDIIADIVVERAKRILPLSHPKDAFEKDRKTIDGTELALLRMDIFGYTGIVVASNNNTAVENISQELPARKKVSREFSEASYLNDVAASVVAAQGITGDDKKPLVTWGLIAAVLGNKTNRKSFCWGLFQDDKKPEEGTDPKDPKAETPNVPTDAADERPASDSSRDTLPTIKQSLEQCTKERQKWKKEWEDAKSAFNKKAKEFESIQEEFAKANKELIESNQLQRQLAEMRNALAEYKRRLAEMAEEQQAIRDDYIAAQANHDAAASRLTTEKITRKPSLLIQILQYSLILSIAKLFGYKNRAYLAWTANLSRLQSELDTAARQAWIQPVDATDWLNRSAGVS